jgi:prepilin-type N-terminal cleavage/methylation domain-containing protein
MKYKRYKTRAFTLIELLTVIAIIGILAGILIPTVGLVKQKATIATSKARISQYLSAIESFKGEYKYYPFSSELDSDGQLDLSVVAKSKIFIETLSARELSSPGTTVSEGGNRRRIQFYTFSEDEIADGTETSAADLLIDGFGNNKIFIVFDHDNDGEVTVPDPDGALTDTKDIRSPLTAYVAEDLAYGYPTYYLYE